MYLLDRTQLDFYEEGLGINYDYEFTILHSHSYWEFIYTLYPIRHTINGQTEIVEAQRILVIKPEDRHSVAAIPSRNPERKTSLLNLKISEPVLKSLLRSFSPNMVSKMHDTYFPPVEIGSGTDIFEKLIVCFFHLNDPDFRDFTCLLIKTAISFICNHHVCRIFRTNTSQIDKIPDALTEITKRLSSPVYFTTSISDIISDSFYSKMQLSRLFHKYYSMTLSEYFQEAKIAYAKRQLEYTNDSILSIASDLGTSLSRFDNAFKRHEGMTPMQYRHFCKSKNREAELETESEREQSDEE